MTDGNAHDQASSRSRWGAVVLALLLLQLAGAVHAVRVHTWTEAEHAPPSAGVTYDGRVIAVTDGDTLRILYKGGGLKVRLAGIDAPERRQAFGRKAKETLSALVFGRAVRVVEVDRDRYGRLVGRVYRGDLDVNAEMVRRGMAWVYRKYTRDRELYRLEDDARATCRGLWADVRPVPPWEYRRKRRRQSEAPAPRRVPPTLPCVRSSVAERRTYTDQARRNP